MITGGFGFVGGRVARHLQQAGHTVILGSRQAAGSPEWLSEARVVRLLWEDAAALERVCQGVDTIVHAAGMNAQDCKTDPVGALAFNGVATARLVAAAGRAGVQRFIYLSTAHVYARPLVGTITEETCPRNLHPYATSHLAGEHAVLSASQLGQILGIVLRLSNAFGAPTHWGVNCWMLLVNDLCMQAVQTRKLVLQTTGLQQRDFVGMTEVSRVAEHFAVGNGASTQRGIFNVGAGMSQSVLSMAQLIQQRCVQVLGFEPVLQYEQGGVDESHPKLTYRADNLVTIGIKTNDSDNVAEIDSLLRFCRSTFTETRSFGE
jgi:UDP-glucose 4-epimerase